jgi:exodeoxyribonuclease V alpha subunit
MRAVHDRLTDNGYAVQISTPTGKAAKRVQEATGIPAITNHRMLGYGMPVEQTMVNDHTGAKELVKLSTGPRYTRMNRMPYDVILCDEYAMVNQEIHRNIIDALKNGGRVCLFGDVNQLRPIEEDKALQDAPSAFETILKKFDGIVLKQQHRQAEGSGIQENATRVLSGRPLLKRADFNMVMTSAPVNALTQYVRNAKDDGIDYSTTEHQIITSMNKTWVGTKKLNPVLQQLFWDRSLQGMTLPRWRWDTTQPIQVQIGSKVVYTANTYDLGNGDAVFNGEIGTVVAIHFEAGSLDIDFVDRVVEIPALVQVTTERGVREFDPRMNIDLAYALTTHKMQGSECQHAIYVMNRATLYGLSRRNLYTGITRARKYCTVIADSPSLSKALKFTG